MKKTLIIFLLCCCSTTAFCQHGYKQYVSYVATITFPDTPKTDYGKTDVQYSYNTDGVYYLVQTFRLKLNLKEMLTKHLYDSLYATYIRSSMDKYSGKLFYKKSITFNGLQGVEYGYKAKVNASYYYRYRQLFCFNHVFIMDGLSSADSLQVNSPKTREFFKSLTLNISNKEIKQENFADIYFTGQFAFYLIITIVLLIVFGILIIYIIKKIAYK